MLFSKNRYLPHQRLPSKGKGGKKGQNRNLSNQTHQTSIERRVDNTIMGKIAKHTQKKKRAWVFGYRGSVTVSAAFAIPLFVFATLCLVYLFEMNAIGLYIHSATTHASKRVSEDVITIGYLSQSRLKSNIVDLVGAERIERSIIKGGAGGINVRGSHYCSDSEVMEIKVEYTMTLPIRTFGLLEGKGTVELLVKPWLGYLNSNEKPEDGQIVYITETGTVYHVNYQCTHLQLSIQFVPSFTVEDLRNQSGGRYSACNRCVHGSSMAGVYITDYGANYHNSLNCSGLKRTIRAVEKSSVPGMRGCSRCS